MKVIFCAWGEVGLGNIIKFMSYFDNYELFVYTYKRKNNTKLIDFLVNNEIQHCFKNINTAEDSVRDFNPDYIVSAFYRHIINENILNLAKKDTLNVHQSLLPKYKGRYAGFWTIYNKDKVTGITYHRMSPKVDSGEIFLQKKINIMPTDTAYSIYVKLTYLAIECFPKAFSLMISDSTTTKPVGEEFTYLKKEFPFDGKISYNNNIQDIYQFCKAVYFPGKPNAVIFNKNKEIQLVGLPTIEKIKHCVQQLGETK